MLKRARLTLMADVHNNNKNASYTAGSGVGASSIRFAVRNYRNRHLQSVLSAIFSRSQAIPA